MGRVLVGEVAFLKVVVAPRQEIATSGGTPRDALAWLLLGTAASMGLWL